MNDLKLKILEVIGDNKFEMSDLYSVLHPITEFVNDPNFIRGIVDIVDIIVKDRDGDKKFDTDDLKVLSKDFGALSNLMSCLFLTMQSIPKLKLKYDKDATEELIFKVLSYVFLIVVPKKTGKELSFEKKQEILNIIFGIYQFIITSQITKGIIDKIVNAIKECKCKCKRGESNTKKDKVFEMHKNALKLNM